jgi:hypothetical protein
MILADVSPESPLYPLDCPEHVEEPLKLVQQADMTQEEVLGGGKNNGKLFIKCNSNASRKSESSSYCNFTCDFCDCNGNMSDEYIIIGSLTNLLYRNNSVLKLLDIYRENIRDYFGK